MEFQEGRKVSMGQARGFERGKWQPAVEGNLCWVLCVSVVEV
jgi:hypothetical protein